MGDRVDSRHTGRPRSIIRLSRRAVCPSAKTWSSPSRQKGTCSGVSASRSSRELPRARSSVIPRRSRKAPLAYRQVPSRPSTTMESDEASKRARI